MAILNMNYGGGGEEYTAGDGIDISDAVISATNTGKARVLTEADYNWPTGSPDGVAAWLLPDGFYEATGVKIYWSSSTNYSNAIFVKATAPNNDQYVLCIRKDTIERITISQSQALFYKILSVSDVVDNLTTANSNFPLSAKQGKVLKDLVDSLAFRGAGAPTTATVGQVGTLYEDTTNGDLYICTDATNPYVWEEVGGGGGLDPATTFWGQTAKNGVVTGTLTVPRNSASLRPSVSIESGAIILGDSEPFYLKTSPSSGSSFDVLSWNFAHNKIPERVKLAAYQNSMTLSPQNLILAGSGSSGVKISGVQDGTANTDAINKGQLDSAVNGIKSELDGKQDALTAGTGITIAEESGTLVISTTGGSGADVFTTNEWNALWA